MFKHIRKYKHKKGFTIIELLVVIAVLAVLVLLAAPRFIGQTEKAKLAQIQNDIRVVETKVAEWLVTEDKRIADWDFDDEVDADGTIVDKELKEGLGVGGPLENITDHIKDEINTNLTGEFYSGKEGKVYYWSSDDLEIAVPENKNENEKGSEIDRINDLEFDEWVEYLETNTEYLLAMDDDFSGTEDGEFRYIGEHEYVIIPNVIKGVNVTSTRRMFVGSGIKVKGVASKNKNITDMSYMFRNATSLSNLDLRYLDTSNVRNMSHMFSYAGYSSIDVSNFNTENVTNMESMFEGSIASADVVDLSNFVVQESANTKGFSSHNTALFLVPNEQVGRKLANSSLTNIVARKTDNDDYLQAFNVDAPDKSYYKYVGENTGHVNIPTIIDGETVKSNYAMFAYSDVKSVSSDNPNVTNMSRMFYNSNSDILDVNGLNTDNVSNMSEMFAGSKARTLDLSSLNTSNVEDMSRMFAGSIARTLDLSSFDTSNVEDMSRMFVGSSVVNVNLESFDTRNVKDMSYMFRNATAIDSIDLSSFDTPNVRNMSHMFSYAGYSSINVSNFNTENVTNMESMFEGSIASVDVVDLSSFVIKPGTNIKGLFNYNKASVIYVGNEITKDSLSSVTNIKISVK